RADDQVVAVSLLRLDRRAPDPPLDGRLAPIALRAAKAQLRAAEHRRQDGSSGGGAEVLLVHADPRDLSERGRRVQKEDDEEEGTQHRLKAYTTGRSDGSGRVM